MLGSQKYSMTHNIEQMITDYNFGLSYEEVAIKHGVSKRLVGKLLTNNVIPRPSKRKQVTHEIIAWATKEDRDTLIINLYKSGIGSYVISKKLQISKKTVLKILQDNGINRDNKYTTLDSSKINSLYSSGLSTAAIW